MLQTTLHQEDIMSGVKKKKKKERLEQAKKLQFIGSDESVVPGKSVEPVLLYHYYFSALFSFSFSFFFLSKTPASDVSVSLSFQE